MRRARMGVVEAGIALAFIALYYRPGSLFYLPVPETKWYPWIWGLLTLGAVVLLIFGRRPRPAGGQPSAWERPVTWFRWFALVGLVLVAAMRVYVTFTIAPLVREIEQMMLP